MTVSTISTAPCPAQDLSRAISVSKARARASTRDTWRRVQIGKEQRCLSRRWAWEPRSASWPASHGPPRPATRKARPSLPVLGSLDTCDEPRRNGDRARAGGLLRREHASFEQAPPLRG